MYCHIDKAVDAFLSFKPYEPFFLFLTPINPLTFEQVFRGANDAHRVCSHIGHTDRHTDVRTDGQSRLKSSLCALQKGNAKI